MAFSARPTSTNELTNLVNLTGHGFFVGQNVIYDGAWVLAQADTAAHCAGTWLVSIVIDANNFYVTQEGYVNNLNSTYFDASTIVAGIPYYLSSANAGNFTAVAPSDVGQVFFPCLVCDTTTTGYYKGGFGSQIPSGSLFKWTVVTSNTNLAPNQGYIANGSGSLTFTLPANYAAGDQFSMIDNSGHGFVIAQTLGGVGQQVLDLGLASTAGSTGTTTTTAAGQTIDLVGVTTNAILRVANNKGTFTYA